MAHLSDSDARAAAMIASNARTEYSPSAATNQRGKTILRTPGPAESARIPALPVPRQASEGLAPASVSRETGRPALGPGSPDADRRRQARRQPPRLASEARRQARPRDRSRTRTPYRLTDGERGAIAPRSNREKVRPSRT